MKNLLAYSFAAVVLLVVAMSHSAQAGNCASATVVQSQAIAVSPFVVTSPVVVQSYAVPTFQAQAVVVPQVVRQKVVVRQARPRFSFQRSVNRSLNIGR